MKLGKKLIALAVICTMMLSMALTATADNKALPDASRDGNATITLHKKVIGESSHLSKYADGTQISDAEVLYRDGTGKDITLGDLSGYPGVKFYLEQVEPLGTDKEGSTSVNDYGKVQGGESQVKETDVNGELTFDNLPFGIYKITEEFRADVSEAVEPFLVSVPLTNPTGDGWLYDIHVYPKNELAGAPEIDKSVTDIGNKHDSVDWHGEAVWIIESEIPAGIEDAKGYIVSDDLNPIFTYVQNSMEVWAQQDLDSEEIKLGSLAYTEFDHYFVYMKDGLYPAVELREDGRKLLAGKLDFTDPDNLPKLYIKFTTTVDIPADELEDYLGKPIYNGATLEYKNQAGYDYESHVEEEPEVHLGGVGLLKVDKKNNAKVLPGAEFAIYATLGDAQNGVNPIKIGQESVVVSDADGIVRFYGLGYNDKGQNYNEGSRTYYIVETKAPVDENGNKYNLLGDILEVEINHESHLTAVKVENSQGFTLPITGGTGTMLITVMGVIFILAAAAIFTVSRRKSRA